MARDILIVDDEADIRELIAGILSDEGYETRRAGTDKQALAAVASRRPSLVILDIWLRGSKLDGIEILQQMRAQHGDLPVVMISGHGNIETAVHAIKLGAYDFIEKPFETDRMLLIVQRAIEAARLTQENRELRRRAGPETEIIGDSVEIAAMRSAIEKVARTGSRVMIDGPAGAGKEVVARALHAQSNRDRGAFVVLNAATMAPERLEDELFGVERQELAVNEAGGDHGTNAPDRVGVFEQAHGGTLFLDEIADMPLESQAKILRVLVDQSFQRVGGRENVEVDVRVVCSTTRDLREEIARGNFREDLYHRLNVVPLSVPPLRDRPSDIPILVAHFMNRSAETLGLMAREVSPDAMAALQRHDWPGNVRQLRNIVENLVIMAQEEGAVISIDMLPMEISAPTPSAIRDSGETEVMSLPLREAREIFEREYLIAQIGRFGGNISRTAEFVGMERSALHRKLKSLGVATRP
ncbi:MAG: sigma-54-dependent Fis family transcriptional regulator [Rhodospirillaceae bacterium]|jgi:two-component system, NtrC family, nitrogen regulation response regulator NtrX|nr:sigma-54-dependent Fis family transcriptional regulator [Rhodospirillaceae bacterium]MBT5191810.1 sigma-54-dependent Fis family transcriptional regulator [Rhodospirillaceae bacterium]MBT5898800.1 sigma-54-dependent Fis family transcriptional regulator [Rhodospirillaceae bacterium]MBT6428823.1 sigma-54-dependent Fis family transcriptional regulator [Rhodospirillaceae bacterium]